MTRGQFYAVVWDLCREFRGSTTSGIRTPKRNAAVGGVPNSAHLVGYAQDVVLDSMADSVKHSFCAMAASRGLIAIDEGDHIHLQVPAEQRIGVR